MYLNILKKDLKRKRAMNMILLIFIILATMFVSSSANTIISVTTALDNYLDMANVPDYLVATMSKTIEIDVDEILNSATSIESSSMEKIFYMASENISFEDESIVALGGTNILQSDKDISMNYFLEDGSIIETVKQGEVYLTARAVENLGLEKGDRLTIEIEGVSCEFTLAGSIKDAIFGSNNLTIQRYIISAEDFEKYISVSNIEKLYSGDLIYIHTTDMEEMLSEIKLLNDNGIFFMDRAYMKFTYVFDMIVAGLLLVVSLIFIAVAFVVLRFTITFTLSEEFREIGVMKAIGIANLKIRGLYLVKYATLSIIGAVIGLTLSFPFGEMIRNVSSPSIIMGNQNPVFVNIICAVFVIAVIFLFCFGCTGKVKKMSPIDAIRNGQTGERFRKKSFMSIGKSKLPTTLFLAFNDIVSSPKRYSIITLIFFLCLSLLLILSVTVTTLKSDSLVPTFGFADFDIFIDGDDNVNEYMVEGGRDKLKEHHEELEETLAKNGMSAKCVREMMFTLPVSYGENKCNLTIYQGTGASTDMYEYTEGTAPQSVGEIAITRISASKLKADIGDTITINTVDGDKEYIITAFFQSMYDKGGGIRFHEEEYLNYIQAMGITTTFIIFTDNPADKEIDRRIEKIRELYPELTQIDTAAEWVKSCTGVGDTLNAVKSLVAILTIVLSALITVLMERSFIAKEQGEIALMKAFGTRNGRIYAYHTARFAIVGMIAIMIGEILAIPLTHLCIDPIFKMMGMELAVDYVINSVEMYLICPLVILGTTILSAFLTSLYTRKIKASDTANIE